MASTTAVFMFTRRREGQRRKWDRILQHERLQYSFSVSQSRDSDETVQTRPAESLSRPGPRYMHTNGIPGWWWWWW